MISSLTVSGLGSSILSNNAATPGENQNGHENSAALICIYKKRSQKFYMLVQTLKHVQNSEEIPWWKVYLCQQKHGEGQRQRQTDRQTIK